MAHSTVATNTQGWQGSRGRMLGLLAGLLAHQILVAAVWVALDTNPPGWDQSIALVKSLVLKQAWSQDGLEGLLRAFPAIDRWQPPLLGLLILPAYAVVGVTPDAAVVVNAVATMVLGLALFGVGTRLSGPSAGLVAVYVAATMPLLFGLARQSYPEFALTAVVTACLWALVASDDLRRRGASALVGAGLGLGLLLKLTAPVFLAGPLLVVAARRLRARRAGSLAGAGLDLAAVAVPAVVLAAIWYVPNALSALRYGFSAGYGPIAALENFGPIWSPWTLFRFLDLLVAWGPSYYYGLLLLALLVLPAAPAPSPTRPVVVAWVVGTLLVFTSAVNKDIRYLAPVLPGVALLFADRLVRSWGAWPRPWRVALLFVPLVNLYVLSFSPVGRWAGEPGAWGMVLSGMGGGFFTYPPRQEDWKTGEIVLTVAEHVGRAASGHEPLVVLTTNHRAFHKDLFNYGALAAGQRFRFEPLPHYRPNASLPVMLEALGAADFVLGTTGAQGPRYATRFNEAIHRLLDGGELPFARVPVSIRLPDRSEVRLYRRLPERPHG